MNTIYKNGELKRSFVINFVSKQLNDNKNLEEIQKKAEFISSCIDTALMPDNINMFIKQAAASLAAVGDTIQETRLGPGLAALGIAGSAGLGHLIGRSLGNASAKDVFDAKKSDVEDEITELENLKKIVKQRMKAQGLKEKLKTTSSRRQLF